MAETPSSSVPATTVARPSRWADGDAYDRFMGRWSARIAGPFVAWTGVPEGRRWLDVGCGTGALTRAVLAADASPHLAVTGVDRSDAFVVTARQRTTDARAEFAPVVSADSMPFPAATFDAAVSALVLNFLPDPGAVVSETVRVCRPGATVAAYLWDYAGGMKVLQHLWETVFEHVPSARDLDEFRRFDLCAAGPLRALFESAGLVDVEITSLAASARFRDFDDFWEPVLAGQGVVPSLIVALDEPGRAAVEATLRERLPVAVDGSITLGLRAVAVRGRVPG